MYNTVGDCHDRHAIKLFINRNIADKTWTLGLVQLIPSSSTNVEEYDTLLRKVEYDYL